MPWHFFEIDGLIEAESKEAACEELKNAFKADSSVNICDTWAWPLEDEESEDERVTPKG